MTLAHQEPGARSQEPERDSMTAGKCRDIIEQLKMFHHGWVGIPPGG
ncbi:hypothetical protein [Erwinia psidii]|nr:hypothetical protein [Erwinia psidii]